MNGWGFALLGAAAGVVQAHLLVNAARGRAGALSLLLRLGLVGAVLLVSALAGHLVAGAAGWLAGFAATSALVQRRFR
ncbi:hypothetical protein [Comamonas sp. JC664]|uniref:hypothetical protein n=1 Tax=Comamonas sp. JC664 TaxID=2801917 RepID=UPI00174DD45C|nr:hypothetical protein [Comamonas sp. JC664]MBL0694634.1 hypothetical protein [Comamonas sp. JC664]GHG96394.1 hypothetical protein GCM10012319_60810 [Comamonas sp. KCTC 72670]